MGGEDPVEPTRGTATVRPNSGPKGFSDAPRAVEKRTAQRTDVERFAEPSSVAPSSGRPAKRAAAPHAGGRRVDQGAPGPREGEHRPRPSSPSRTLWRVPGSSRGPWREGSDADVARAYGLTRSSVRQYLTLVRRLPADLLGQVEAVTDRDRLKRLSPRQLLAVAQVEGEGKRRPQARGSPTGAVRGPTFRCTAEGACVRTILARDAARPDDGRYVRPRHPRLDAMEQDHSWAKSAERYRALYRGLVDEGRG
jgi:hypothetical protein